MSNGLSFKSSDAATDFISSYLYCLSVAFREMTSQEKLETVVQRGENYLDIL